MSDFDAEKARAVLDAVDETDGPVALVLAAYLSQALAALSRPAGDVALVEHAGFLRHEASRQRVNGSASTAQRLEQAADALTALSAPVDMLLFCPQCGLQHVDEPDERTEGWTNPPHRSHLCHGCGHIWRPCDRATNGVAAIATTGKVDGSPVPVLATRQAWAKVRAEIEAFYHEDPTAVPTVTINRIVDDILAILAQHTPQAGKED